MVKELRKEDISEELQSSLRLITSAIYAVASSTTGNWRSNANPKTCQKTCPIPDVATDIP